VLGQKLQVKEIVITKKTPCVLELTRITVSAQADQKSVATHKARDKQLPNKSKKTTDTTIERAFQEQFWLPQLCSERTCFKRIEKFVCLDRQDGQHFA